MLLLLLAYQDCGRQAGHQWREQRFGLLLRAHRNIRSCITAGEIVFHVYLATLFSFKCVLRVGQDSEGDI